MLLWGPQEGSRCFPAPPQAGAFRAGMQSPSQEGDSGGPARSSQNSMVHRFSPGLEGERLVAQCKCHAAAFNKGMFRLLDCRTT